MLSSRIRKGKASKKDFNKVLTLSSHRKAELLPYVLNSEILDKETFEKIISPTGQASDFLDEKTVSLILNHHLWNDSYASKFLKEFITFRDVVNITRERSFDLALYACSQIMQKNPQVVSEFESMVNSVLYWDDKGYAAVKLASLQPAPVEYFEMLWDKLSVQNITFNAAKALASNPSTPPSVLRQIALLSEEMFYSSETSILLTMLSNSSNYDKIFDVLPQTYQKAKKARDKDFAEQRFDVSNFLEKSMNKTNEFLNKTKNHGAFQIRKREYDEIGLKLVETQSSVLHLIKSLDGVMPETFQVELAYATKSTEKLYEAYGSLLNLPVNETNNELVSFAKNEALEALKNYEVILEELVSITKMSLIKNDSNAKLKEFKNSVKAHKEISSLENIK